jgi:hypothetical protein
MRIGRKERGKIRKSSGQLQNSRTDQRKTLRNRLKSTKRKVIFNNFLKCNFDWQLDCHVTFWKTIKTWVAEVRQVPPVGLDVIRCIKLNFKKFKNFK